MFTKHEARRSWRGEGLPPDKPVKAGRPPPDSPQGKQIGLGYRQKHTKPLSKLAGGDLPPDPPQQKPCRSWPVRKTMPVNKNPQRKPLVVGLLTKEVA